MPKVFINGKFYTALLEGMPRVGAELVNAFDILLAEPEFRALEMTLIGPKGIAGSLNFRNIRIREQPALRGFLWEQVAAVLASGTNYLVNFTSTAPVLKRNGCVVVHDAQFRSTPLSHGGRSALLYGLVTPLVAKTYRNVVTISEYAKAELLRYGVTARTDLAVIHNGADHALRWVEDDRVVAENGLRTEPYLLANGVVHHHKNARILFEAARQRPDIAAKLVMFGSSKREDFEARGIEVPSGVRFLGRVTDGELCSLIKHASLFLFPSLTEGFGLPPLEAMSLGCATICARAGAMPEVCADGAAYADPADAAEWIRRIDELLGDEAARRALAAAGLARAGAFTWEAAARRYLTLFMREA